MELNSKSTKIIKEIKSEIFDWLGTLMPSFLRAENWQIKLIWSIIFILMTFFSSYLLAIDLNEYFEYNVNTNVKIIHESESEFPIVSVCNLNPFKTNNQTIRMTLENILKENNISYLKNERRAPILHRTIYRLLRSYVLNIASETLKQEIGHSSQELILKCFFNKGACFGNDSSLSMVNISWFYSFDYGNCYRLSSLYKTGKYGETGGLNLELYAGNSSLSYSDEYMNSRGLRILIHNKSDMDMNIKDNGIDIPTGRLTNIAIKRTFNQRLPYPHSDCIENLNLKNMDDSIKTIYMKKMQYEFGIEVYSKISCENVVYQDYLFKNCSCIDPSYLCSPNFEFKLCSTFNDNFCYEGFYSQFYSNRDRYVGNECPEGKLITSCLYHVLI